MHPAAATSRHTSSLHALPRQIAVDLNEGEWRYYEGGPKDVPLLLCLPVRPPSSSSLPFPPPRPVTAAARGRARAGRRRRCSGRWRGCATRPRPTGSGPRAAEGAGGGLDDAPPPLPGDVQVTVLVRVCRPGPAQPPLPPHFQAPDATGVRGDALIAPGPVAAAAAAAGGELVRVAVRAGATVAELKRLLARLAAVAAERQRLVFAGRLLRDGEAVGGAIGFCGASGERVTLLLPAPPAPPAPPGGEADPGPAAPPPPRRAAPPLRTRNRFAPLADGDEGGPAGPSACGGGGALAGVVAPAAPWAGVLAA